MTDAAPESPKPRTRSGDVLLVLLAAGAGVVDALSLTVLGVFTAAVTANVVIVGLSLGDADPHTALRAGVAVVGFIAGVLLATRALRPSAGRGLARAPAVLAAIASLQIAYLIAWLATDARPDGVMLDILAIASAIAMGGQTATARTWHDIPTTYISGTLTLVLSDMIAGSSRSDLIRLAVIGGVVAGATAGGLLLSDARETVAALPALLTAIVGFGVYRLMSTSKIR